MPFQCFAGVLVNCLAEVGHLFAVFTRFRLIFVADGNDGTSLVWIPFQCSTCFVVRFLAKGRHFCTICTDFWLWSLTNLRATLSWMPIERATCLHMNFKTRFVKFRTVLTCGRFRFITDGYYRATLLRVPFKSSAFFDKHLLTKFAH
jgi:hypothetical protein